MDIYVVIEVCQFKLKLGEEGRERGERDVGYKRITVFASKTSTQH
jgi:hypothetical protein